MDTTKLQEIEARADHMSADDCAALTDLVAEVRRLTAALATARREGAEGMREAALAACERVLAVSDTAMLGRSRDAVCLGARRCVVAIRALPLDAPGGAS